jgi:hypothetical protein
MLLVNSKREAILKVWGELAMLLESHIVAGICNSAFDEEIGELQEKIAGIRQEFKGDPDVSKLIKQVEDSIANYKKFEGLK